jgi:hypothetical protein
VVHPFSPIRCQAGRQVRRLVLANDAMGFVAYCELSHSAKLATTSCETPTVGRAILAPWPASLPWSCANANTWGTGWPCSFVCRPLSPQEARAQLLTTTLWTAGGATATPARLCRNHPHACLTPRPEATMTYACHCAPSTYDHRTRDLVSEQRDPTPFKHLGVPRSTAAGWIRRGRRPVVSANIVTLDPEGSEVSSAMRLTSSTTVIHCSLRHGPPCSKPAASSA